MYFDSDHQFWRFPLLDRHSHLAHGFTGRVAGVEVGSLERGQALARLGPNHWADVERCFGRSSKNLTLRCCHAEQVHGAGVAVVEDEMNKGLRWERAVNPSGNDKARESVTLAGVDALVTAQQDLCLGLYAADCALIYLFDPVRKVVGLAHSGRKGTEENILGAVVGTMEGRFGVEAKDLLVQVSPCIRTPAYEVNFSQIIRKQARASGVISFADAKYCTAKNVRDFYSYRRESGKTGRMLGMIGMHSP